MATDPIYFWRYSLRAKRPLNARAGRRDFEGALLKVGDGCACIHPWPELGDPPLEAELETLRNGGTSTLLERALHCASVDGEARREGRDLFEGLGVPRSHRIVQDPADVDTSRFTRFKVKLGADLEANEALMEGVCEAIGESDALLRPDFNEVLEPDVFLKFATLCSPEIRDRIDFVEDPCPYDEDTWDDLETALGCPLAVDRSAARAVDGRFVRVLKPATDPVEDLARAAERRALRTVVTSYMEHPLGQVYAAWSAAKLSVEFPDTIDPVCGLLTHELFEPDAFIEKLRIDGCRLVPPGGNGLGFDDLLDGLPWKKLT